MAASEVKNTTVSKYRTLRWLLIPVIAAHNFEEWLTIPFYGEVAGAMAGRSTQPPSWTEMQIALLLVTIMPALIMIWAVLGRQRLWKELLVCSVTGIYFANVFLPHIPAAIVTGGYTPGLLTATLVNLPFCLYLWRQAIREGILSFNQVLLTALAGAIVLIPSIVSIMMLAKLLAKPASG